MHVSLRTPRKQKKERSDSDIAARALQEAGPEPPKGKVGDQERKFWNDWKKKIKALPEKKYAEVEGQAADQLMRSPRRAGSRTRRGLAREKATNFRTFELLHRAPSKSARGRERRLGKNKRSSTGEGDGGDEVSEQE